MHFSQHLLSWRLGAIAVVDQIRKWVMSKNARLVSEVFNPLINPIMTFLILALGDQEQRTQNIFLNWIVAITFASGLIFLYIAYLKQKRAIDSTELIIREQRISPLTFAVLSYALGFGVLTMLNAPWLMRGLMFCYATNTMVVLMITRRWKISIHTTGIAGPLVALTYQFGWMLLPLYILIPIVGLARVKMHRHTHLQVVAGGILGVAMTIVQLYYFRYYLQTI
jgi:membrane-associated phospholipid phosphatase